MKIYNTKTIPSSKSSQGSGSESSHLHSKDLESEEDSLGEMLINPLTELVLKYSKINYLPKQSLASSSSSFIAFDCKNFPSIELTEYSNAEILESCNVDCIDEEESYALCDLRLNTIENSNLSRFVSSADTSVSNNKRVCTKSAQPRSEVEECEDLEFEDDDTPSLSSVKIKQISSFITPTPYR